MTCIQFRHSVSHCLLYSRLAIIQPQNVVFISYHMHTTSSLGQSFTLFVVFISYHMHTVSSLGQSLVLSSSSLSLITCIQSLHSVSHWYSSLITCIHCLHSVSSHCTLALRQASSQPALRHPFSVVPATLPELPSAQPPLLTCVAWCVGQ